MKIITTLSAVMLLSFSAVAGAQSRSGSDEQEPETASGSSLCYYEGKAYSGGSRLDGQVCRPCSEQRGVLVFDEDPWSKLCWREAKTPANSPTTFE